MKTTYLFLIISILTKTGAVGQNEEEYFSLKWNYVATQMPSEWYASEEAKLVAENVLIAQKEIGGWPKNKKHHHLLSEKEKASYIKSKTEIGATIDNGATIAELRFLAKMHAHFNDERYRQAFKKGLDYLFISQYENGGWPQFYPLKGGYANYITYNDNAMVNVMNFLNEIASNDEEFASLKITEEIKIKAQKAIEKGVQCFLKTQILVDHKPTVWCAQHDEKTFAPAKARSYELVSFSGAESAEIALFLMNIENPSEEIIAAVNGAVNWFEKNKIEGIKVETEIDQNGNKNRIVVEDKNAPLLWGRFYDLETSQPYFCDRDGIKKNSLAEIGYDRRNGYKWYVDHPAKVLEKYPTWKKKWLVD